MLRNLLFFRARQRARLQPSASEFSNLVVLAHCHVLSGIAALRARNAVFSERRGGGHR